MKKPEVDTTARHCLGCNHLPVARRNRTTGMFIYQCSNCGWYTEFNHSFTGARCSWHMDNKPNDSHILMLWQERWKALQTRAERIAA